ncbi:hypothetical protein AB0J86_38625 [Micromonospora sp. NPDC049559]|uniref:hypothetical protein n=1 Tax=Micromonospora sp. NPDC049559 TaxID=3155923 RepID=UPI00341630E0
MTQPVKVYLDAMSRFADRMEEIGTGFGDTRTLLVDADVTEDSFGMLPESRDAAKTYEQRTTDGLDVLRAGEDVFTDLGKLFRDLRDGYQGVDQAASNRFGG